MPYIAAGLLPPGYLADGLLPGDGAGAGPAGIPPPPVADPTGPRALAGLATLYCTDEDLARRAWRDFVDLCPKDQQLAQGADGAFDASNRWYLTSASVSFADADVRAGHVVHLTAPRSQFPGEGALLAVDQVFDSGVSLRRLGKAAGAGQPPAPAGGLTGVKFEVLTFDPQIDTASFEANEFFGLDPNYEPRSPTRLYNPRELEQFLVLTVLQRAYSLENKAREGDYALKLASIAQDLRDLRARLVLRWGTQGDDKAPQTAMGARYRR